MHTLESRFLYSEAALRGAISGQHPICFHILLHPKVHGAIRFLLWWLFLHRRLRARQRGSESFDSERRSTRTVDQLRRALLVFIRVTGKVFRRFPQAFRLRLWRLSSGFPLLLLSNDASPHSLHLQVPVKMPVSNLDCVMDSTRVILSVKYKIL